MRQVDVLLYPADEYSTIVVTHLDTGAALTRKDCTPRLAGPMTAFVQIETSAIRFGYVRDCYGLAMDAPGTNVSVVVQVTASGEAGSIRLYRVTIARDAPEDVLPLYKVQEEANGTAGVEFAPASLTVDYSKWSARYGNDTLRRLSGPAALVGNTYGMDSLEPPSFTPFWAREPGGAPREVGQSVALVPRNLTTLVAGYAILSWSGGVTVNLTVSGDYRMGMSADNQTAAAAAAQYATAPFWVQPTSMSFALSVAVEAAAGIAAGRAEFIIEARDVFSNPMGADPHHGLWNLPEEEYLPVAYIRADVCGQSAPTNEAVFWEGVFGGATGSRARRRALLQVSADATLGECQDFLISMTTAGFSTVRVLPPLPRLVPFSRRKGSLVLKVSLFIGGGLHRTTLFTWLPVQRESVMSLYRCHCAA